MQLKWNDNELVSDIGIDKCVLYTHDGLCVPWNGLEALTVIQDIETSSFYQNGRKISMVLTDETTVRISAYTYPEILNTKRNFYGLVFRSFIDHSKYKIEIFYNLNINFDDIINSTINEENDISSFAINCNLVKSQITGFASTANVTIFSDFQKNPLFLKYFEDILYGSSINDPYLPSLSNVINIFKEIENTASLLVVDYGDGSWLCAGSDDMVKYIDDTSFRIDSLGVTLLSEDTYRLQSY